MRYLAQDPTSIFGAITPPPGPGNISNDPIAAFGLLVALVIRLFITVAVIFVLLYLLWGAFDWIVSGGEKERIAKAQRKMTHAVIGLILLIGSIGLWLIITSDVVGIVKRTPEGGFSFELPTFKAPTPTMFCPRGGPC
jgi:hypothetical protein